MVLLLSGDNRNQRGIPIERPYLPNSLDVLRINVTLSLTSACFDLTVPSCAHIHQDSVTPVCSVVASGQRSNPPSKSGSGCILCTVRCGVPGVCTYIHPGTWGAQIHTIDVCLDPSSQDNPGTRLPRNPRQSRCSLITKCIRTRLVTSTCMSTKFRVYNLPQLPRTRDPNKNNQPTKPNNPPSPPPPHHTGPSIVMSRHRGLITYANHNSGIPSPPIHQLLLLESILPGLVRQTGNREAGNPPLSTPAFRCTLQKFEQSKARQTSRPGPRTLKTSPHGPGCSVRCPTKAVPPFLSLPPPALGFSPLPPPCMYGAVDDAF